jgi:glutathione S-transferase
MLRVWGRTTSSNVMKVLWLLGELGLDYERIDAGGTFGRTSTPEYRAMQPVGLVPALEDGNFTLFESNAILRYLCNAYAPASSLYPAPPRERGIVDAWLDFQQTVLTQPASTYFIGLVRTPPEKRDMAAITEAIAQGAKIWAILDERLGRMPYLCGDCLTIADIAFGPHVHRWLVLDLPGRPELKNLAKWYERLKQRAPYAMHCTAKPS